MEFKLNKLSYRIPKQNCLDNFILTISRVEEVITYLYANGGWTKIHDLGKILVDLYNKAEERELLKWHGH